MSLRSNKIVSTTIICFAVASMSRGYIRFVSSCPKTPEEWKDNERFIKCSNEEELYHCIRTVEHCFVETCVKRFKIFNSAGGCPVLITSPYPFISKSLIPCQNETGCPTTGDPPFYTNELYKYPSCLDDKRGSCQEQIITVFINKRESENSTLTNSYRSTLIEVTRNSTSTDYSNRAQGKTPGTLILVAISGSAVAAFLILSAVIIIIYAALKRKRIQGRISGNELRNESVHQLETEQYMEISELVEATYVPGSGMNESNT